MDVPNVRKFRTARVATCMVAAAALLLLAGPAGRILLAAQTPAPAQALAQASPAGEAPAPHHRKRPSPAHPITQPVEEPAQPVTPPPPEAPHWPVNDQPAQATVTWDSQGLRIDAENSSLEQILKDFSTETGAKVEGLGTDQRVYGMYGPGQARDVLSQLLQGSGYNVIMIGDQGQGTPAQILLSERNASAGQAAANKTGNNNGGEDEPAENDADEQQPYQPPMPMRPGMGPGGPPRTPQQIMQEMQQRQQQLQQQRNNNPNNPNPQ